MTASLALQKAIRARLANTPAVTALVPVANIFDRNARPEGFPCIVLGEDQEVADDLTLARQHARVFVTLHVWAKDIGLSSVKAITGEVRRALVFPVQPVAPLDPPFVLSDFRYGGARFLRDPNGTHSHAVITFEALIGEVA